MPTDIARQALEFKGPSGSVANNGIEVAVDPTSYGIVVRHSGEPHGPMLVFDAGQWRRLLANVRRGGWPNAYFIWDNPDHSHVSMSVPGDETVLRFTVSEMAAFERAVHNGELALPAPKI